MAFGKSGYSLILPTDSSEDPKLEINDILRIHGHVPHAKCDKCLKLLKECVRKRMLGQLPSAWTQDEIIAAIQKEGGSLKIELNNLVKSSNFDEIKEQLNEKFKLLLTGPPGIGKTFIAEHLADIHRFDGDPFEIVTEEKGISTIRNCLDKQGKFLFFLNDPWGHYKLSQDADRWSSELPKLLKSANTVKRFLITSRTGIKERAIKLAEHSELLGSEIQITENNYNYKSRKEILNNYIRDCKPWQRDIIDQHESKILANLLVPFSIEVFANRLLKTEEEVRLDIDENIKISNIDTIGSCLAQEVLSMGVESIASAVIIWALFMITNNLTKIQVRNARVIIKESGYPNIIDTEKIFDWLIGAKWIQPRRDGYIAHPTVLDGLETLISSEPAATEEAIVALLQGLASTKNAEDALKIIRNLSDRQLSVPDIVKQAINTHLLNQIKTATGYKYAQTIRDLIEWSTSEDEVTQLVRILFDTQKFREWAGFEIWKKPELKESDVNRISKSIDAHECAIKFINETLVEDYSRRYKPEDMLLFFNTLEWDMSAHFITAAIKALERGSYSPKLLVETALSYENPHYERLLNSALAAYDDVNDWWKGYQEMYKRAQQAEFDANYASHIEEEPGERFLPVKGALETIISMRRRAEGYHWIAKHPRCKDFLEYWVEVIDESTGEDEIEAIIEICSQTEQRIAWKAIKKAKCIKFAPVLVQFLSNKSIEDLKYCIKTLCEILSPDQWADIVLPALDSLSYVQKASIWLFTQELDALRFENLPKIFNIVESTFSSPELRCLQICKKIEQEELSFSSKNIDNEVIERLHDIAREGADLLTIRAAWVLYKLKEPYEIYIQALIESEDRNVRENALRLNGTLETESSIDILRKSLSDVEYRCRRVAMWALADLATEDDKKQIVAKNEDPSAPVREACAKIIGFYKWTDEQRVLCKLLKDRRDTSQDHLYKSHIPNHHVARAAALSLLDLGQLSQKVIDKIIGILTKKDTKKDDIVLHYYLIEVLGQQGGRKNLKILHEFLDAPWHMPGMELKGFPLRYAAAWSIFNKLLDDESIGKSISTEHLYNSASHSDGRLAGPCLISLGLLGSQAEVKVLQMLRQDTISKERALLIYSAARTLSENLKSNLIDYIGDNHPGIRILNFLNECRQPDEKKWKKILRDNDDVDQWINSIQPFEDVNPALRFVFHHRFGDKIEPRFPYDDLRSRDLAKSIPVVTTRSMFGGE